MNNIIFNRFFITSVGFICLQQMLVGLSTYFIGLAGENINLSPSGALFYTGMFFFAIFIAYILGGVSLFYRVKLSNSLWKGYYLSTLEEVSRNHSHATEENKKVTQLWLSGEALSTFDEVGFEFVEILAIYFNVIFTTIALFIILGAELAGVIVFCMLLSVILLYLAKGKIGKIAGEMQSDKITALHFMSKIWDSMFYGDRERLASAQVSTREKVTVYFKKKESYKLLEQIISCAPILISIPLLVGFSYNQVSANEVAIGALVAVLPRSLQLFQNIHAASMSTSQILLLKNKITKLYSFPATLKGYDYLSSIDHTRLSITNTHDGSEINVQDILGNSFIGHIPNGRLLIMGGNGAGKSSLIKYLKSKHPDALFFGPGIDIGDDSLSGSTGQKQLHQLELLSGMKNRVIFLDEWDANLDTLNTSEMDNRLNALSIHNLIIEIRHKM
ncbi:ABC transporter ATP-binding protein [Klebsiella pneumoniae]|uniref:ATP-binding cassette domain-containing protein n=1 Tax=Klebsiella pneumoniae TaxID=573 RepID=UPI000667D1F3|nr:ABC transporter ATP-binding protein [Klebsiella pneumoniae]